MKSKPTHVLLCCLPLAVPVVMAGFGAHMMNVENNTRAELRVGNLPPIPGVERSDDYAWHSRQFQDAANELIASGRCAKSDFAEHGGFQRVGTERGKYTLRCATGGLAAPVLQISESGKYRLEG